MSRSWSRGMRVGQPGLRRATALAAVTIAVAGCSAVASGATGDSSPGAGHQTASSSPSSRPSPSPEVSGPAVRSARIMIVGDSITEGSSGDYTWQYWLYKHLRADGVKARMVGPYHSLYNNLTKHEGSQSYANPHFQNANDANWGMTLFREKNAIGAKVAKYRPDYLLVMLGLDDIYWFGLSQQKMTANLAGFIKAARRGRPRIRIVLGLIPPNIHEHTNASFAASVASYNRTIEATASKLSTSNSPIAVARDGAGINVAADLWDGTHPNANGEIKIAAAFADVLAGSFHVGDAYPTPYPVMPIGPRTRPRLTVTPLRKAGQAKLAWTLAPGANGYRVFQKDTTQRETKFKPLPFPLSPAQDPWIAAMLTPGDVYYFQVQACKGSDCGVFSNVVTVTAP